MILTIVAIVGVLVLSVMLVFLLQSFWAPRLLSGILSEAEPQTCIDGKQWILYDCLPNPITRFGCIIPGTNGASRTKKRIAVQQSPCLPSTDPAGERIISYVWQEYEPPAGVCSSAPNYDTCCNYAESCAQKVKFICVLTGAGLGGENQCLPDFLPAPIPPPGYNSTTDYTKPENVVTVYVPCRSNFC